MSLHGYFSSSYIYMCANIYIYIYILDFRKYHIGQGLRLSNFYGVLLLLLLLLLFFTLFPSLDMLSNCHKEQASHYSRPAKPQKVH